MTKEQVHIRCAACGHFNVNANYCVQCGHPLNVIKQREQRRMQVEQQRIAQKIAQKPSAFDKFLHKMMNHRLLVVQWFFKGIYGIWVVVMAITMFLAWLIGMIVA